MPSQTLLQLSDSHLSAAPSAQLNGVNTTDSLTEVIDLASASGAVFDAVIATGDLSQDGSPESYNRFLHLTRKLSAPLRWLPGNHDCGTTMRSVQPNDASDELRLGPWAVLTLDSTVAGASHGEVGPQRLAALDAALARLAADPAVAHVLIAVHHNPLPNGAQWMDSIGLRDGTALLARLAAAGTVRGLVHGHIHQAFDELVDGVRVLGSPSSCAQFAPIATEFVIDTQQPGYRWLRLHDDGRIETAIARLPEGRFSPSDN